MGTNERAGPRITTTTLMLLDVLLDDPTAEAYGLDVGRRAGLAPGSAHVILKRLERDGWLTSRLEEADPHDIGRRPRRYYQLTAEGVRVATREVARARARRAAPALRAHPAPGGGW
jgi:PadR family transcriptional regulator PadR